MKKKNILVFPCGSEIALDIHSSVKYSTYFNLIGANSINDHGRYVYTDYMSGIPFFDDERFISTLKQIVKEKKIDAIYPTMDSVITKAKQHESELGCKVIAPPFETTRICLSKRLTYKYFERKVKIPKVYKDIDTINDNDFPIFAKPDIGYSAKGTKKLNDRKEAYSFLEGKNDILLLEWLPGEEYTVDCFTNNKHELIFCKARVRSRISNGISVNTYFVEEQKEFIDIANTINSCLDFQGAWFFQVKRDCNNQLTLMEIASRLGGSSLLSRALGVNLPLLTLFDAFGYEVNILTNDYQIELDRALASSYKVNLSYKAVYCDFDDCLILDNKKLNTELVRFLYKCVNNHIKLYLISKHSDDDLSDRLKEFRIDSLFDEIILIDQNEEKKNFITNKDAIFIDDSHSEREKVKKAIGIPVFSPDMIDVLI